MRYCTLLVAMTMMIGLGCESRPEAEAPPAASPPATPTAPDAPAPPAAPEATAPVPAGTVELFNGRDLTGWTHVLNDPEAKMEDVWSVSDGVLHCKGKPVGYLKTLEEYENYVLDVEWRWPEGSEPGNNGVLVHTSTPGAIGIWPKSIEVQLQHGAAGDFWIIGTELQVTDIENRRQGRRHLRLVNDVEKPLGEWNHMEITCRGDEVLVKVNGVQVNHATACNVTRGTISLQSEGAPIEYRNIRLRPLGGVSELASERVSK